MMQQRLKAKLMVVRWGSEAEPGAGRVSSESKAPWKRGRRQSPALGSTLQSWGTVWVWHGVEMKFLCSLFLWTLQKSEVL